MPADGLAKGRDDPGAVDGLPFGERRRDREANLLMLTALEPTLTDGLDARTDLATHKELEARALDRRRWWGCLG